MKKIERYEFSGLTSQNVFWKLFRAALWRYRAPFAWGVLTVFCINGLEALPPVLIKNINESLEQGTPMEGSFQWYLAYFLVAYALIGVMRYGWRMLIFGSARRFEAELRSTLFSKVLNGKFSQTSKLKVGDTISLISQDVGDIGQFAGGGVLMSVDIITYFFFLPLVLFGGLGPVALYLLLPLLCIPFLTHYYEKKMERLNAHSSGLLGKMSEHVFEETLGIKVFRVLKLAVYRRSKFYGILDDFYVTKMGAAKMDVMMEATLTSLSFLSQLVLFVLAYFAFFKGSTEFSGVATIGKIILAQQVLDKIIWPMMAFSYVVTFFQKAKAASRRILPLLQLDAYSTGEESLVGIDSIELKNFSFTYPDHSGFSLKDIELSLTPGKKIAIVGDVGSGKSTLLRVLAGLFVPEEIGPGLLINGQEYATWDGESYGKLLALISQEPAIFNQPISQNVRMNCWAPKAERTVETALREAALWDDLTQFSDGDQTMVGEKGVTLSGGQKQRLSMARNFFRSPKLYLWDDTISALDVATERQVLRQIFKLNPEAILVLATHRISSLKSFDLIYVLEEGRVIQRGLYNELALVPGRFQDLLKYEEEMTRATV